MKSRKMLLQLPEDLLLEILPLLEPNTLLTLVTTHIPKLGLLIKDTLINNIQKNVESLFATARENRSFANLLKKPALFSHLSVENKERLLDITEAGKKDFKASYNRFWWR